MSRYQATVTLHHIDDLAYSAFVAQRIKELFGYTPSIRHREEDSTVGVVISRREIVEYLHTLGLPVGNKIKQGLDMPSWIKKNHAFSIACVRGLVDTDGSIFTHHYKVNGKWYAYKKLCFTSASPTLVLSVHKVLRDLKLHARISRNGRDARLESISDMERYFKLIGTHNPKHLRRYSL
jgi:intein/homing endonuclease